MAQASVVGAKPQASRVSGVPMAFEAAALSGAPVPVPGGDASQVQKWKALQSALALVQVSAQASARVLVWALWSSLSSWCAWVAALACVWVGCRRRW
mmetsp:Transcript_18178/g.42792  ORF Transcript_18178/g.42792 Transcript_18178/m.42792 type:complete len:97 (-) Transcript_18178:916-1206(-)